MLKVIKCLEDKRVQDTNEELKSRGLYFDDYFKFGKNYQIGITEKFFTIYDNEGHEIVSFSTKEIKKLLSKIRNEGE